MKRPPNPGVSVKAAARQFEAGKLLTNGRAGLMAEITWAQFWLMMVGIVVVVALICLWFAWMDGYL